MKIMSTVWWQPTGLTPFPTINHEKGVDGESQLSVDQFHLGRQVRTKGTITGLTQSAGRHVNITVPQGDHREFTHCVANIVGSSIELLHAPLFHFWLVRLKRSFS